MILPGVDKKAIANWAAAWFTDRLTELSVKHQIWLQCEHAYACKFGETWAEVGRFRSQRYMSIPWQTAETLTSAYIQGVMPDDDWFEARGRTPDDESRAMRVQALMKYQFFRTEFRDVAAKIIKSAVITGNAPFCVEWCEENVQLPDGEAYEQQMQYVSLLEAQGLVVPEKAKPKRLPMKNARIYDGPKLRCGNIYDYVRDLKPSNDKYALRAIRSFKSAAYLKAMSKEDSGGYKLYENVNALNDEYTSRDPVDSLRDTLEEAKGINQLPKDMVELIQFEGNIEIPNVGFFPNHIMVIGNRNTLLRFEPNPFYFAKPSWDHLALYPDPSCVFGYGALEPILGLNDGIQARSNQAYEANALAVDPPMKVSPDGIFDSQAYEDRCPGALIPVSTMDNLQPLFVVPDAALKGMNEVSFLVSQINQITGASDNFGGGVSGDSVSATQASIQAQMSSERRKETFNHLNSWLMDVLARWNALNQQLMDEEVFVRIVTDSNGNTFDPITGVASQASPIDFQQVSPKDIAGMFDIVPVGANNLTNNRQKAMDMLQLVQAMLQSPMAQAIKLGEATNELFRMFGYNNAYKFVKSQEEIMREREQASLEQALAGGGGETPQPGGPGGPEAPGAIQGIPGLASASGVPEGPGALPGGPDEAQLAGNRFA